MFICLVVGICMVFLIFVLNIQNLQVVFVYMNDVDIRWFLFIVNFFSIEGYKFFWVIMVEIQLMVGNFEKFVKYQVIVIGGGVFNKIVVVQCMNFSLFYFCVMMFMEFLGYNYFYCLYSYSFVFENIVLVIVGCNVYVGYWFYQVGIILCKVIINLVILILVVDVKCF